MFLLASQHAQTYIHSHQENEKKKEANNMDSINKLQSNKLRYNFNLVSLNVASLPTNVTTDCLCVNILATRVGKVSR